MLRVDVFDTRLLPPADRFGQWLDVVESSAPALISSAHAGSFDAHARAVELGSLRLTDFTYPSLTMARTPKLIRRADPEMYQLSLTRHGVGAVNQQRRESVVHAAEFTLLDNSRPFEARHEAPPGQLLNAVTVNIPHAVLPLSPAKVTKLLAASISASTGMGGLLAQFLRRIAGQPEQFTTADTGRLSAVAVDLISAMLARQIDAEDTLPAEVRQHALRLRIEAFIGHHLGDPELTPPHIAAAHHISLRTLHRLFDAGDATVAGQIRRRRLERCRRDLVDPLLAGQAVRVIARRWGFTDKAHFSRAFRAAYGHSPQAYRDQFRATGEDGRDGVRRRD